MKYYLGTKTDKLQLYAMTSKGKDMHYSQRQPPAGCLKKAITDISYLHSTGMNLQFWIRDVYTGTLWNQEAKNRVSAEVS